MLPKTSRFRWAVVISLLLCCAVIFAVRSGTVAEAGPDARGRGRDNTRTASTEVRATGRGLPLINFQDGRALKSEYSSSGLESGTIEQQMARGEAKPLSLASEDLNGDGFPDLIVGYASPSGGILALHLGNAEAFAPTDPATIRAIGQSQFPDPFLKNASLIYTPEAPDLIAIGDFNGDGKPDIITATKGSSTLHLLSGNNDHGFNAPDDVTLSGSVTTLTATQANEQHGGISIAIGVNGEDGASILVYAQKQSILTQKPYIYRMPAAPTTIVPGRLDDDRATDLAIVAGGQLYVLHGRAGQQSDAAKQAGIAPANLAGTLESVSLPFAVNTAAISDFIWDRDSQLEMAVAGDDGAVRIIARGDLDTRPLSADEIRAGRRVFAEVREGKRPASEFSKLKAGAAARWVVSETTSINIGAAGDSAQPVLMGTLASGQRSYDLLAVDPANKRLHIGLREDATTERAAISLDAESEPIAALPLRLNLMGRPGIVMLSKGQVEPVMIMSAPTATISVTTTADTVDAASGVCSNITVASLPGPDGVTSLREAVCAANGTAGADIITLPSGTYQLTRMGDDNTASLGDLDINTDITINGAGQASTFIQGSSNSSFTGNMGDKAIGVNQDGTHTTLNFTMSGVTVRFTRNDIAVNGAFTQTGGGMDIFLTGTGAMPGPTTSLTNCTFDSNAVAHSWGGGINVDSGDLVNGTNIFRGTVQLTGCTISNNKTLSTSLSDNAPAGGGLNLNADIDNVTLSSCSVTGNQTSLTIGANGGGINMRHSFGGTITLTNTSVDNNSAGSDGGGILTAFNQIVNITGGSISGNTAQGSSVNSMVAESSDGGGFFSGSNVGDSTTLTGVTISNNHADNGTSARGGGVEDISNSPLNIINCTISGNTSDAGGGVATTATGTAQTTAITGTTISNNTAPTGAGLFVSAGIMTVNTSVANASTIAGNTASGSGGGIAVTGSTGQATVSNTTISGNTGTTSGGALFISAGTLNVGLSRIVSNTSGSGTGIARTGGTATLENNWWGCDGFPNASGCETGTGTFDANPRIDLRMSASPATALISGTSTLTADVVKNTDGNNTNGGNAPSVLVGLNLVFDGGTKGSINAPLTVTVPTNGTVTKTFTVGPSSASCGAAAPTVALDSSTQAAAIQVQCPDLVATKTNNVSDAAVVGQTWTWKITVANNGDASGNAVNGGVTFPNGIGVVGDTLPNSANISYGAPSVSIPNVSCTINASKVLICSATSPVTLPAGSSFDIQFTAVASAPGTAVGTYTNPRSGGFANVDAAQGAVESNENNNDIAANSVVVSKADTTTTIDSDSPDPSTVNTAYTVGAHVSVTSPGSGTPTGTITISDGTDSCMYTLPATTCNLTSTTFGAKTLTATYNGDTNYNATSGASSGTAAHVVIGPPTISKAFGPGSLFVNGTFSQLTFTITNPNLTLGLTGLAFTDNLPSGTEVASTVGLSNTCNGTFAPVAGNTVLTFSGGTIAANSTCSLKVNIIGTTPGAKLNTTGAITSTEGGTGTTSNTATLNVFTAPQIAKSFGATTMTVGGTTTVTFTITNPASNPGALTTITFIDSLPSGMVVVNPPVPTNTCSGSVTAVNGSGTISLGGASIATPGNTCQVQATVMATSAGVKNNSVTVSSGNGGTGNTSLASITVSNPPTVVKAFSPSVITPGGTSTLTVTLTNPNASLDLTEAAVTDTLPSGVTTVASTAATACGGTAGQTSGSVSLAGGTIPHGGSCTLTVNVTSAANGVYTNNIAVGDVTTTNSGSNTAAASATLTVAAPPVVAKSFSPANVSPGGTSTMTITITNPAANPFTLNGLAFADSFPTGMTVASTPNQTGNCSGTVTGGTSGSTSLQLTNGSLTSGSQCTITVDVTATQSGTNSVTVSSTNGGTSSAATADLFTCLSNPIVTDNGDNGGTSQLRYALANVCAAPNNNIKFNIGSSTADVINLSTGKLVVARSVNIANTDAASFGAVTINGGAASRIFDINSGITASIGGINLTNGKDMQSGAIQNDGTLTLNGVAIYGNNSDSDGGAIRNDGTLTILNSTLSGNSAKVDGGAILNGISRTLTLVNDTITNNRADSDGNASGTGGGIISAGTLSIKNSIVAGNFSGTGSTESNVSGTIGTSVNNILTGDPMIGALAFNGGPTQTHRLLPSSTAINGGDNTAASAAGLTTDQRGTGFARVVNTIVDIGAYETNFAITASGGATQNTTVNANFATLLEVTVTESGNPASGVLVTFTAPGSGQSATFPGGNTATTDANGKASVQAKANTTSGGYQVTASLPAALGTSTGTFNLTNTAGTSDHLVFIVQPSNAIAGNSINPPVKIQVVDQYGNLVTTDTSNVSVGFGNNAGGGTLSGTSTITAVGGVATFGNLSINKAGTGYTLAATDGSLTGATSNGFNISPAAADHLAFVQQPSNTVAGAPISPPVTVSILDQFNNLVTSDNTHTVSLTIGTNPGGGSITAGSTATVMVSGGIATFSNFGINKTGIGYTLSATTNPGGVTAATSASFDITPATADHLAFSVQPSNTVAGAAINPAVTVRILDQFGNLVTTDTSNVTVGIGTNPGGGTLSGTVSAGAIGGIASFNGLSINKSGTGYTLSATDGSLTAATSSTFNISPASAHHLAFGVQPTDTVAGLAVNPAVQVRVLDQFDNLVTTDSSSVTVAIGTNPVGGTLSGTSTGTAVGGVATFSNLSINKAGMGYTLKATDSSLTAATSSSFDITPGVEHHLAFGQQPSNTVINHAISPAVTVNILDQFGNLTTSTANITIAIGNNPGGGTLGGTTTLAASGGTATFSDLSINKPGTGYTLTAASGALAGATSNAFNETCVTNPVINSNDNGTGSLRQVILEACPGDTITFNMGAGLVTSPISLSGGQILLDKNLIIQGPGANVLTVQNTVAASSTSRVFNIGSGVTATISGLTISGGNLDLANFGGGISNSGTLDVVSSTIHGNTAGAGGGIFNSGVLTVTNSTISGNNVINSTGGGIVTSGTALTVRNSTISGNTAVTGGGGIYRLFGSASISNSTVTSNTITSGNGGGIFGSGMTTMQSTIVAGNINLGAGAKDYFGLVTSLGYNLIGASDGSSGFSPPLDLTGTNALPLDAGLVPLADNGGPTKTHSLCVAAGVPAVSCTGLSPAIDKGKDFVGTGYDQRGTGAMFVRPVDLPNAQFPNAAGGDGSDIGAFEINNTPPTVSSNNVSVKAGSTAASFTIATAADPDQVANTLGITINSSTTATTNGVTVSGLSIAADGTVSANIATTCGASTALFNLVVTDNQGATGSGTLTVTVNANTAPILTYSTQTVTAGSTPSFNPATGPSDNGTISSIALQSITPNNGGLTLSVNNTTGQVGVTSATISGGYTVNVVATDGCGAATPASFTINVTGGPATHLSITAPATATAGAAFNFTVKALDAFNNVSTGYTGTVHFTSTAQAPILPGNSSLVNGVGTFGVTIYNAGIHTISAYDLGNLSINGISNGITVGAATAVSLKVTAPANVNQGALFSFTVTAMDAFNNPGASGTGTIHFTSTDGSATLPADNILTAPADGDQTAEFALTGGMGTFSATLRTAGVQTITATDTGTPAITGTTNNITVSAVSVKSRADFDGDGRTDISVFRPSDGNWYISGSSAGFIGIHWGLSNDTLIPGDFDGDGKADTALWRPSAVDNVPDYHILNSNGFTYRGFPWGLPGDIPITGDYDGDGKVDFAIFRPSTNIWWILLSQSQTVVWFQFGTDGDIPMVMDFDGDGKTDLAVFRPSDRTWYMSNASGTPAQNFKAVQWGLVTDILVPADYDGDHKDDVAVYRPSTGMWYILRSSDSGLTTMQWGVSTDMPVPGDYDGDGKNDIAVFRPSTGTWYIMRSTSGFMSQVFGANGDTPIPRRYIP